MGEVASAVQLPGDAVVHSIVRLVQFAGVLVGVATGNPLLANASVKSLAHDALTDVATRAVRETVAGLLRPLPPRDIPPPPPPRPNQRPARTRDGLRPGALRSDQRVPPAAGTTPHRGVAPPPSRRPDPGRGAPGMSRL